MSQHDTLTPEQLDQHLDALLKAAGSALRHYTMQKSRDDMRAALRAALSATQPAQAAQSEPAAHWHRLYLEKCQQYNDRIAQLGAEIDDLEHAVANACHRLKAQAQQAGEVLTESYVQTVPDKCDRIVWRGYYYTLPPTPPAQAAADANGSA